MSRLVLVRHGEAAAGWGDDPDPGLSERGRAQADAMASALDAIGPLPVIVSPLRRTRETAAALERRWGVTARVDAAVGEVPSPTDDLGERMAWLRALLPTPWEGWPPELQAWRRSVASTLASIEEDAVVVTHYVFITVAVGSQAYAPDYCSSTVVDVVDGEVRLVAAGGQAATVVR